MRFPFGENSIEVTPLGDTAVRIKVGDHPQLIFACRQKLAEQMLPGVRDIVPAYETIVVHFDATESSCRELFKWIEQVLDQVSAIPDPEQRVIEIPVLYNGEDLSELASHTGLPKEQLVERHAKASYRVRMLGFMPGFPYLEGLDESLAMPRRDVPRTKIPAGSVGIGGNQTGIYPFDSPGGWNLLGRTPINLFDPRKTSPSLLEAGDFVKFRPIEADEFEELDQRKATALPPKLVLSVESVPLFEVISPGLQTTIQDLGRWGSQRIGVTPGGVMDHDSARLANWLVGNHEAAPLLEMALVGPQLKAMIDMTAAIVGATSNHPVGRPFKITRGNVIDLKQLTGGSTAYLAISGGFDAGQLLGGHGTDLRCRFGGHQGRALLKGDQLRGRPKRQTIDLRNQPNWFASTEMLVSSKSKGRIRFIRGPQAEQFSESAWKSLLGESFSVSSQSDRMGIRLEGQLAHEKLSDMPSEPTTIGAIQVPPNGSPIVLMADRQTVGGYPVIGVVASVDIPRLAQLRMGEKFQFVEISLDEAEALLAEHQQNVEMLEVGIKQAISNKATASVTQPVVKEGRETSKAIDLNGDAGEGVGVDEEFIPLLTSVNIACGAHAGDQSTMRRAVQIAIDSGVAIGAHPGLEDRENFGRLELPITPTEAFELVLDQIKQLQKIADEYHADLQHVKPHGALYHMGARDADFGLAIAQAVDASKGPRWLLGPPGSEFESAAEAAGLQFAPEAFVDRSYDSHGNLIPRTEPNALLTDANDAIRQACSIAIHGEVSIASSLLAESPVFHAEVPKKVTLKAKTICLHGDTPRAVSLAKSVRQSLERANIRVRRFGSC